MKLGLNVYCNGDYLGFIPSRKQAAVRLWIRTNVLSTHMGEWAKSTSGEYRYRTTIGREYNFIPATSEVAP